MPEPHDPRFDDLVRRLGPKPDLVDQAAAAALAGPVGVPMTPQDIFAALGLGARFVLTNDPPWTQHNMTGTKPDGTAEKFAMTVLQTAGGVSAWGWTQPAFEEFVAKTRAFMGWAEPPRLYGGPES